MELCFQGTVQRTHTAEGCAPLWNEHFVLPYQPTSGELGPSMMEEVRAPWMITAGVSGSKPVSSGAKWGSSVHSWCLTLGAAHLWAVVQGS